MESEGVIQDPATKETKRFHRDEKSWTRDPKVFGPHTPEQSLPEIYWLLQEVGYTQLAYHDLIDLLREKYEKVNGYKTPSWYETFYGREIQRQDEVERKERVDRWKSDRNWIFRTLISKWVKPRKR